MIPSRLLALAALVLTAPFALAATAPKLITLPQQQDIPASITLLKADGKIGRDNPFYDNYRPQLKFSAGRDAVTCAVRLPPPQEKVEPGETTTVSLRCLDDVKLVEGRWAFTVYEGGRKVGEGAVQPAGTP